MKMLKFNKKYIPAYILAVACTVVAVFCLVKAFNDIKYHEDLTQSSLIDVHQILLTADGNNGTKTLPNTKDAIDDLRLKGFTTMKIDVRLTKDKKWVALKEKDISSVTKGKGDVSSFNYYELLNYNLKSNSPLHPPVVEPAEDIIRYAYENEISSMVFIHDYDKSAIKNLIKTLSAENYHVTSIAASDIRILRYVEKLNSSFSLVYFVDEITEEMAVDYKNKSEYVICFDATNSANTADYIEKLNDAEINCICYNAETLKSIEEFYKFGVRQFINNTVEVGMLNG